jgi:SAM-dependent methyltransferase
MDALVSAIACSVVARTRFHGVRQIVRFNWPSYAVAAVAVTIALAAIPRLPLSGPVHFALSAALGLISLWIAGSLATSWMVYDLSTLMTGRWIPGALGFRPNEWINMHAGLDETTPVLRMVLGGSRGRVYDIFDSAEMTEPSIARARRLAYTDPDSTAVDFRRLPAETSSVDAVLLLLAAHELRTEAARVTLFCEIHRVLAPGGRVVVAEHLRDGANFLAFGPGFLHFHSRRRWVRSFTQARLAIHNEFSITPFVRVFVLGEPV